MKSPLGWVQGSNAQAAANEMGGCSRATSRSKATTRGSGQPMIAATLASLETAGVDEDVEIMLFDAGYLSNLKADGPDRLIATGKSHTLRESKPTTGPPPKGGSHVEGSTPSKPIGSSSSPPTTSTRPTNTAKPFTVSRYADIGV